MRISAVALNASDDPVNVPISWRSLTPTLLSVDESGTLIAWAPGEATVRASVATVFADLTIQLVNPPIATLDLGPDTATIPLPSGPLSLTAEVRDAEGELIVGTPLVWSSSADRIASVSPVGILTGVAVGSATISASAEGHSDSVVVVVSAEATALTPLITLVSPAQVQAGVPIVIQGQRFASTPAGNAVRVDGIPLIVTAASATQLTAVLPVGSAPCLPTRTVALQVGTSAGIGVGSVVLQVATRTTLLPGEAFLVTTAAAGACQELNFTDGEFVLTVVHAGAALGGGPLAASLRGRVATGTVTGASVAAAEELAVTEFATPEFTAPRRSSDARRVRQERAHAEILAASTEQLRRARPVRLERPAERGQPSAGLQLPATGAIVPMRVPDLDSPAFCSNFTSLGMRSVFTGAHVVILEDTTSSRAGAATLARGMDSLIVALGEEIESNIWPILTKFGDPLVMDSRLDANGRVAVVLTPRMNAMRGGAVLGAVVSCDFFPRAQVASSNVGEVLYLQVPTNLDAGFGLGTRERWRWEILSVVAHELKHVVSFAERIVRGQPLEEMWLEEATARVAEELYARTLYAAPQRSDAKYAGTLRCEAREAGIPAGCGETPRVMRAHLEGLYEFLAAPTTRSPLGATSPTDASFYGSAWALTRWALDQSAQNEGALLSALTTSGQSGVANLEGRIGLPWDVMLSLWSLAVLTDGRVGLIPASPQLTIPSWDLTDLFANACLDVGSCGSGGSPNALFGRAHPAQPVVVGTGNFDLTFPEIAPGSFAAVRLSGTVSTSAQLVELRGAGASLPPTLRLSILRVR